MRAGLRPEQAVGGAAAGAVFGGMRWIGGSAWDAFAENGRFTHHLYSTRGGDADQNMIGIDVAAVTSIVLTNRAATQVETVRNISAFIFHPFRIFPDSPIEPLPSP